MRRGIVSVLPSSRCPQRGPKRTDHRFDNEAVPTNQDSAGGSGELQQQRTELGVEATNIDTSDHPHRLAILEPDVNPILVLAAPCLALGGGRRCCGGGRGR